MGIIIKINKHITNFQLYATKIKNKIRTYGLSLLFLFLISLLPTLISSSLQARNSNIKIAKESLATGITPLMNAIINDDLDGVKFFSKSGEFINQKNIGGATAMHLASRKDSSEIATLLLAQGAEVNIVDNEGWSPLMRATLSGNFEIMQLLISHGARGDTLNNAGESLLTQAANANCSQCLSLLLSKFNFLDFMQITTLKKQLEEAFITARNQQNQASEIILSDYLSYVLIKSKEDKKITPILEKKEGSDKLQSDQKSTTNKASDAEKRSILDQKPLSPPVEPERTIKNQPQSKNKKMSKDAIDLSKEGDLGATKSSKDSAKYEFYPEKKITPNKASKEPIYIPPFY